MFRHCWSQFNLALCPWLSMGSGHRVTMIIFILTWFFLDDVTSSKLNVPRVLLPYSDTPPSFSLLSESGCYSWTSTRPDIVLVKPDQNSCKSSAVSIYNWLLKPKSNMVIFTGHSSQSDEWK